MSYIDLLVRTDAVFKSTRRSKLFAASGRSICKIVFLASQFTSCPFMSHAHNFLSVTFMVAVIHPSLSLNHSGMASQSTGNSPPTSTTRPFLPDPSLPRQLFTIQLDMRLAQHGLLNDLPHTLSGTLVSSFSSTILSGTESLSS